MFFTQNPTRAEASSIPDSEKIHSLFVKAWAGFGSEDPEFFRIGNDTANSLELTVYSDSPSVELSLNRRQWAPAVDMVVPPSKVGDAIFVRAYADPDSLEGEYAARIHAGSESLPVSFFLAERNEGDTSRSQSYRFTGEQSREIREFFETDGEEVRIIEYVPQPKPSRIDGCVTLQAIENQSVRQWANPYNEQVGFKIKYWPSRAFLGDRETLSNSGFNIKEFALSFGDKNTIILPHDFAGFDPSWQKTLIPFSQLTPFAQSFQGTVWTVLRDNTEYALRNIRRMGFFRGQILFYLADLVRVHYPTGSSEESFLPWNELLDNDWKPIEYVRSWSTDVVEEPYSEYLGFSDENPSIAPAPEPEPEPETAPICVAGYWFTSSRSVILQFNKELQLLEFGTGIGNWTYCDGASLRENLTIRPNAVQNTVFMQFSTATLSGCSTNGLLTYTANTPDIVGTNGLAVAPFTFEVQII